MSENKEVSESLTSLKIQVDNDGRIHTLTNDTSTLKFINPISLVDLVEIYDNLLEETGEGLTPLEIHVDHDGQVHSFSDINKTWKFMNPISLVDLVETYKGVLINVEMEVKGLKEQLPKSSRGRFFNRR